MPERLFGRWLRRVCTGASENWASAWREALKRISRYLERPPIGFGCWAVFEGSGSTRRLPQLRWFARRLWPSG